MDRRAFVAVTASSLLPLSADLRAQSQVTPRRIGFLIAFPRALVEPFLSQLRPELEKFGWTDGRNIVFLELRTADGKNELLPPLAVELVAQGLDLILVQTVPAIRALMQATKSIPIVMVGGGNPVDYGIVADYAKPGGNVTGSAYLADQSARKLMQLLKEAAPRLRSLAVFVKPSNEGSVVLAKQVRADAVAFGMQTQVVEVAGPGDVEPAFAAIRRANTESIVLPPEALIRSKYGEIAGFAQAQGLPLAVVGNIRTLPASGLIAFGPSNAQYPQITARYVARSGPSAPQSSLRLG